MRARRRTGRREREIDEHSARAALKEYRKHFPMPALTPMTAERIIELMQRGEI